MLSPRHHTDIHELQGDGPTSLPISTPMSGVSSHPSLRPGPLNFSRPRYVGSDSYGFRSETPSGYQRDSSQLGTYTFRNNERNQDEDTEETAQSPPAIGSDTNVGPLDTLRTSIDEALPPPIPTRGVQRTLPDLQQSNESRGDSIFNDFPAPPLTRDYPSSSRSSYPSRREDSVVGTSLSSDARKRLSTSQEKIQTHPSAPQVCIYRPYLDYASSNRSSVASSRAVESANDATTSYELEADRQTRHELEAEQTSYELDAGQQTSYELEAGRQSQADSESTEHSSIADFAFDSQMGLDPRGGGMSPSSSQRQRWIAPPSPLRIPKMTLKGKERQDSGNSQQQESPTQQRQGSTTSSSEHNLSPATTTSSSGASSTRSRAPTVPARIPRIVKRTSIDQMSEHVRPWAGESMSDRGSISSNEWTSSEVDTSGLSVEKIHKLKKKGINPALYVEMQNARKGKSKWVSPLGGNSFLS